LTFKIALASSYDLISLFHLQYILID